MKAVITDLQNQAGTQINILVDYLDDDGSLIIKRVLMLPEEKYYSMSQEELVGFIKQEGDRHAVTKRKVEEFNPLVGLTIEI